jgi:beta-glucosidase
VDAGAASIMSAYNLYKGIHCGHHDYLLRKVLKEEWDFDGFVMSDFVWGVKDTVAGANNGEDLEMCCTIVYGDKLVKAVRDGLVPESRIDDAALRLVRTILTFEDAYAESGNHYGEEVIGCDRHIALALKSAQEGITLLKNDQVLPFNRDKVTTIAVIGKLGEKPNIGDYGSSRVFPKYMISPVEGIRRAIPGVRVIVDDGSDLERAKKAAASADAVILVVGFDHGDEGEYVAGEKADNYTAAIGGDRKTLDLHTGEITLIKAVGPENSNSVAVIIGGNTTMITEWMDKVSGILMAYYPGQEGGTALAQILFGDINPSGKLPYVQPVREADLPRLNWDTTNQWYDYYHGYSKLEKEGIEPLFPYGFGLSYTSFEVSDAAFSVDGPRVTASCSVRNTGSREGDTVIQMYVGFKNSKTDRPVKLLRGFSRISLKEGEQKQVLISCPVEKLWYYNAVTAAFELESMEYEVYIGTSSAKEELLAGTVRL